MKHRIFPVVLAILAVLLLVTAVAAGEETVVKSYKELLAAVNEQAANEIYISPKYKHSVKDFINLEIDEGRTVTLHPADGAESAVINGRVDVYGGGELILDRVDIVGPNDGCALWVGGGAHIVARNLTGGSSKKGFGGPALIADDICRIEAETLTGGAAAGAYMLGGDAAFLFGEGVELTAQRAVGGEAALGFGGAGIISIGGARATVKEAAGGSGAIEGGAGVLRGWQAGTVELESEKAGELLETKKKLDDRSDIKTDGALIAAIRRGETKITLSSKFKSSFQAALDSTYLFLPDGETVEIIGAGGKKNSVLANEIAIYGGSLTLTQVDLTASDYEVLRVEHGSCSLTGNINSKGGGVALYDGKLTMTGNIKSQGGPCVKAINGSEAEIHGSLTNGSKTDNVVNVMNGSHVTLEGDVKATVSTYDKKENVIYAAFYISGEGSQATLNGSLTSVTNCVNVQDHGSVEITGDLTNKNYPILSVRNGSAVITGNLTSGVDYTSLVSLRESTVTINGDIHSTKVIDPKLSEKGPAVKVDEQSVYTQNGSILAAGVCLKLDLGSTATINGSLLTDKPNKFPCLYAYDPECVLTVSGDVNGNIRANDGTSITIEGTFSGERLP